MYTARQVHKRRQGRAWCNVRHSNHLRLQSVAPYGVTQPWRFGHPGRHVHTCLPVVVMTVKAVVVVSTVVVVVMMMVMKMAMTSVPVILTGEDEDDDDNCGA